MSLFHILLWLSFVQEYNDFLDGSVLCNASWYKALDETAVLATLVATSF